MTYKSENINVRIFPSTKEKLKKKAKKKGYPYPKFIRKFIGHVCSDTGIPDSWVDRE